MTVRQHNIAYFASLMGARLSRILFILFVAIGFWQCDSPIELDYSNFQSKLVINAQVSADGQFVVNVTSSTTPVSIEKGDVPDGLKVTLTDNSLGINIPMYRENDLFYASIHVKPRPGNEYIFRAEAPGFESVEAVTKIPVQLGLVKFEVTDFQIKPSDVTPMKSNVSYKLELDFGVQGDAYLHLIFRQHSRIRNGAAGTPIYEDLLYVIEPEYPEESGYIRHVEQGILISLSKVESNPLVFSFVDYTIDALLEELGNMQVEVRTISPEYYKYFESLSRQLLNSQDPFAEPIQVFSNVDGGLGNFSSYNVAFYEIGLF